ncbi:MAG: EAL domain-containing protein [Acidobacteriota bacterium]
MPHTHHLLIVDRDPVDAQAVLTSLRRLGPFHVEWVTTLNAAVVRLGNGGIGAVALNHFLSETQTKDELDALSAAAPHVPILVICAVREEALAIRAVGFGAHDYLLDDRADASLLARALGNIVVQRALEQALFVERERASVALDAIGDGVLGMDTSGHVTYLNVVAEAMTGWCREDAQGRPIADVFTVIDGITREAAKNPMEVAIEHDRTVRAAGNCILVRRDGFESAVETSAAPIHNQLAQLVGAVVVLHDTGAPKAVLQQIAHLAQHDFLTSLPNRMLLNDRLAQAIARARRHSSRICVLFLDVDRFKHVNDSLGHMVGDRVLQVVGERLTACVRSSDTVSRLGGDEFVVVLPDLEHADDHTIAVTRILSALSTPYVIGNHVVHAPASIGASRYPEDGLDADTLIKHADIAMYAAKDGGRGRCQFFTHDMNLRAAEHEFIEGSLRPALERGEFALQYQPKVRLDNGAITGVEALIRWWHPERGPIAPSQFVPVAEECGLILPIGNWVLRQACLQARAWADAGLAPVSVAVNVSALEFKSKEFLDGVRMIIEETRVEPNWIELELTETALMQDAHAAAGTLRALKDIGIQLAVDDFGTGYSSLSYLQKFPVDALKVDRTFVHEISGHPHDSTIVSAVIALGKTMKKRVIAEGVESKAQLDFLITHGCHEGQGFYFHRPMVSEHVAMLIDSRMPRSRTDQPSAGLDALDGALPAHVLPATRTKRPAALIQN